MRNLNKASVEVSVGAWPKRFTVKDLECRRVRFAPDSGDLCGVELSKPGWSAGEAAAFCFVEEEGMGPVVATPGPVRDILVRSTPRQLICSFSDSLWKLDSQDTQFIAAGGFGRGNAYELALDRTGQLMAGAFAESGDLVLKPGATDVRLFRPPAEDSFSAMFPNIAMAGSGEWVALSFGFEWIYCWNLQANNLRRVPRPDYAQPGVHPSIKDGEQFKSLLPLVGKYTRRIWLSPDGARLIAAGLIPSPRFAPFMCLWVVEWQQSSQESRSWFISIDSTLTAVDLSHDHQLCAANVGQSSNLALWDMATGQRLVEIPHRVERILDVRFSHDSSRLAIAGATGLEVHALEARRWLVKEDSTEGFWWLVIDGVPCASPVGSERFVSAFTRLAAESGSPPTWASAETAGRQAAEQSK